MEKGVGVVIAFNLIYVGINKNCADFWEDYSSRKPKPARAHPHQSNKARKSNDNGTVINNPWE